jgi:hypothetical protein
MYAVSVKLNNIVIVYTSLIRKQQFKLEAFRLCMFHLFFYMFLIYIH